VLAAAVASRRVGSASHYSHEALDIHIISGSPGLRLAADMIQQDTDYSDLGLRVRATPT
jgi:hypothetical protein